MEEREKRSAALHRNSRARAKLERSALLACAELLLDLKTTQVLSEQRLSELKGHLALYIEVIKHG